MMKKFFAIVLSLCLVLGCASASASSFDALQQLLRGGEQTEASQTVTPVQDEPQVNNIGGQKEVTRADAPAAPASNVTAHCLDGLTVVSANMVPTTSEYSSYIYAYVYVEVRNDGSSAVKLDGDIAVTDKTGKTLETQSYVNCKAPVIAPGETAYMSDYLMIDKDDAGSIDNVACAVVNLRADSYDRNPSAVTFVPCTASIGTFYDSYGDPNTVGVVEVKNTTNAILVSPKVVCGLYDAQGSLVAVVSGEIGAYSSPVMIYAGSSFCVNCKIDNDLLKTLEAKGVTITSAKGMVYVE